LGGNYEEEAIEILRDYLKEIPGEIEGYGRDDSPEFCAQRMEELIEKNRSFPHKVRPIKEFIPPQKNYSFQTMTGEIYIDYSKCPACQSKGCIDSCSANVLKLEHSRPVLAREKEETKKGKCTECLACEIFCKFHEQDAVFIHLPTPGLKEYRDNIIRKKGK
jgi:ferredoxin